MAQRKVLAVKKAVQGNEGRREGLPSTAGTFRRPKVPLVFIRPLGDSINRMPMALSKSCRVVKYQYEGIALLSPSAGNGRLACLGQILPPGDFSVKSLATFQENTFRRSQPITNTFPSHLSHVFSRRPKFPSTLHYAFHEEQDKASERGSTSIPVQPAPSQHHVSAGVSTSDAQTVFANVHQFSKLLPGRYTLFTPPRDDVTHMTRHGRPCQMYGAKSKFAPSGKAAAKALGTCTKLG